MIRRPPRSTLFPSTTLSRSLGDKEEQLCHTTTLGPISPAPTMMPASTSATCSPSLSRRTQAGPSSSWTCTRRSEEHTSELQSRQYLVCRLLLEKKKEHIDSD